MQKKKQENKNVAAPSGPENLLQRPAVGYIRVSTTVQGEFGISLDAQRAGIEGFANHAGYSVIEIFEDNTSGVGAKSFTKRVGLQRALDLSVSHDADLIVWDWDRLSRHSEFEKQIRKHLPESDRVICAKRGTDLREAGKHAAFKHNEAVADEISRRTIEGMRKKRAEGVTFGNPEILTKVQPLGTSTWSKTSKGHDGKIADALRELKDPFAITHAQAADFLNEKGLRTLHGRDWDKSRVRAPLKRAREILREEEKVLQSSHPNFGMF